MLFYIVEPLEATTNLFEHMDLGFYHAWLMHQDFVPNSMDHKIVHMDVSKNSGFSPQIIHELIGFSIINHPFWGVFPLIFGNTHIFKGIDLCQVQL